MFSLFGVSKVYIVVIGLLYGKHSYKPDAQLRNSPLSPRTNLPRNLQLFDLKKIVDFAIILTYPITSSHHQWHCQQLITHFHGYWRRCHQLTRCRFS